MNIVHVINYFQPRLGYQEYFLAREQIRCGHNVTVITSDRYYPFRNYDVAYKPLIGRRIRGAGHRVEEGIPVIRLRTFAELKYRVWLLNLEDTILSLKPDCVIVHNILANAFRTMRLKQRGHRFKLVVDEHLIEHVRNKSWLARYYNGMKRRRIGSHLDQVEKFIGVTDESCEIMQKLYGIPREKIEHIPLGADSDLYVYDRSQRERLREYLDISESDILLVSTGKINPDKGVETLIRAFSQVAGDKVHLLMVGSVDWHYKQHLLSLLDDEKRRMVIFHDFVLNRRLPEYYSAADICVWGDTISASMLEAMACSRPIIGCDLEPVRERTTDGNGLCYRLGDASDLCSKIDFLVSHPEVRQDMGRVGRQLVQQQLSWRVISERFLDGNGSNGR